MRVKHLYPNPFPAHSLISQPRVVIEANLTRGGVETGNNLEDTPICPRYFDHLDKLHIYFKIRIINSNLKRHHSSTTNVYL